MKSNQGKPVKDKILSKKRELEIKKELEREKVKETERDRKTERKEYFKVWKSIITVPNRLYKVTHQMYPHVLELADAYIATS